MGINEIVYGNPSWKEREQNGNLSQAENFYRIEDIM